MPDTADAAPSVAISASFRARTPSYRELADRSSRESGLDPNEATALRMAPLLLMLDIGDGVRNICVGDVLVEAFGAKRVALEINVIAQWSVNGITVTETDSVDGAGIVSQLHDRMSDLLPVPSTEASAAYAAARHAKTVCEISRDTVMRLRELRYALETTIAAESRQETADERLTALVSSLLMLNIACGRAVDRARDAAREGLWAYIDDADAYHAYRRLRDSTLVGDQEPATTATRPWMRLHDTGIRQCEAMAEQLAEESTAVIGLLEAASSVSNSRDADAQTRLNALVALLSLGFGVPALVLALYGAEVILPLETVRQKLAFAPIAVPLSVAALLAMVFAPKGKTRRLWIFASLAVLTVLAGLILGGIAIMEHATKK